MWRDYFGDAARIIGVDSDPRCLAFSDDQTQVILGNQDDRDFLRSLRENLGSVDIVIDDGGHRMSEQIATFEELWPAVVDGGVYLTEDVCTSYWPEYGGGYREPASFIEYAKGLIDKMYAWHARGETAVDSYTRSIAGMHVYDSVVVLDKAIVEEMTQAMTGVPTFEISEELQRLLLPPAKQ